MLCSYGCGQNATHQFKNGKWCCCESYKSCPVVREKNRQSNIGKKRTKETRDYLRSIKLGKKRSEKTKEKIRNSHLGKICYEETKEKLRNINLGKKLSEKTKEKISKNKRLTISKIKERYPFFSQIEEMRYNPDKLSEKEIQVHCKNHDCENSKENGGWFTPTKIQLYERIRGIEKTGNDGSYFYCSDKCKKECILYGLRFDPNKEEKDLPYTSEELQTFNDKVKELDKGKCQICGTDKDIHVHHIIPKKLEPFFALDPVNGICLCKKCHYKYGHKDECNTWNIANRICNK